MAHRWHDSFDFYSSSQVSLLYSSVGGSVLIASGGRFGNCIKMDTFPAQFTKVFDAQATWIVGFAYKPGAQVIGQDIFLAILYDGATDHVRLNKNTTDKLYVTRGGTTLATGTTILNSSTWYYIELKATISDTGSYELRINGVTELSNGSVDTRNGGNASADRIRFGPALGATSSAEYGRYDDLYINDGSGGVDNDFWGDVRVEALFPDGNGNTSNLVGSDGNSTDNYLLVDETTPNGDTDYVESSTVGDKDTYTMTTISSATAGIKAISQWLYARKTDAGTRKIKPVVREGGTETDGTEVSLSTTYNYYGPQNRVTNPRTSAAWDQTDIDGLEAGVKVTA